MTGEAASSTTAGLLGLLGFPGIGPMAAVEFSPGDHRLIRIEKSSQVSVRYCSWLVVWLPFLIFPYIGNLIIPIDVHIFQRGGPTTNQVANLKSDDGSTLDPQSLSPEKKRKTSPTRNETHGFDVGNFHIPLGPCNGGVFRMNGGWDYETPS